MTDASEHVRRLFAFNLRKLRKEAGLSQPALSALTGITAGRISEYETGVRSCNVETLGKFAEAFDVPVAALFDETGFDEKPKRKAR